MIVNLARFPSASFVGHLAGLVVGFPLAWGWLNWLLPPAAWACAAAAWHCRALWHSTRPLHEGAALGANAAAWADASSDLDASPNRARASFAVAVAAAAVGLAVCAWHAELPPAAGWAALALALGACAAVAHPPGYRALSCPPLPVSSPLPEPPLRWWPAAEDRKRLLVAAVALSFALAVSNLCALAARWPRVAGARVAGDDESGGVVGAVGEGAAAASHDSARRLWAVAAAAAWLPCAELVIAAAGAWVLATAHPDTAAHLRELGFWPPETTRPRRDAPEAFAGTGVALGSSTGGSRRSSSGGDAAARPPPSAVVAAAWGARGGGAGRRGGGRGGKPGRSATMSGPATAPLPNPWV